MRYLKTFGFAALAAYLMAFVAAGTASATIIETSSGNQLKSGTGFDLENEGNTTLHAPIGVIECEESRVQGVTTNDGGLGIDVVGGHVGLDWSRCNATVHVLAKGGFAIAGIGDSNGSLIWTGAKWTVEFLGFHCIFSTNNTKIGTITGGSPATLDVEATIPRTGGRSGIFCGSTAIWTGAYKIGNPPSLLVTK